MSSNEEDLYNTLTLSHLQAALRSCPPNQHPPIGGRVKRDKRHLLQTLLANGQYWVEKLNSIAADVKAEKLQNRQARRMRQTEGQRATRQEQDNHIETINEFLDTPSQEDYMRCYRDFYEATTNDALKQLVCGVCARLLSSKVAEFSQFKMADLPNRHRLHPDRQLDAHNLMEGCLLERKGCFKDENGWNINLCSECLTDLQPFLPWAFVSNTWTPPKKNTPLPPKYSLANNLWVGPVPSVLKRLSFAEQLLIARVYPRVFVFKLFPQGTSRRGLPREQLQNALRGNVTSFDLNSDAIADMINGNLMPQETSVLASVISVTMVKKGKDIDPNSLNMFRVHRDLVQDALEWLKVNNPKYYGNIIIDQSRMDKLPVDDIPSKIYHNIHHEEDISVINFESDGYVPTGDEGEEREGDEFTFSNEEEEPLNNQPDVVPLQYLGVMDNDLSKVPTNELMKWGLQNMWNTNGDSEYDYAVRWGGPVNTFGQPPKGQPALPPDRSNYWESAFPLLYPYGVGGIEADRPVALSLIEHTRWSLRHHDRRFRYHGTFMFVSFGIYQRRQALASAKILMQRKDFDSMARILSTITPEDLKQAKVEEERRERPSNPAIRTLRELITTTSRRVVGSGPARIQLRSQIWSTSMYLNPPTIWITINPDDLHHPIAQIFAGQDIDMDAFVQTAGPDSKTRAENIAKDPFAAGEFFNFLITIIIEQLFGITSTASRIHSRPGILGRVKAYFGTVECQGRGTLHLHMLVWLHNAPPSGQVQEMLKTPEFRSKVLSYIKNNIRSYHPQLATPQDLKSVPTNSQVAYSRPPDPSTPLDVLLPLLKQLEAEVVRTKQMHKCTEGRCLRPDKNGQNVCKRRAPWTLSEKDGVNEDGTYLTKRTLGYMNTYCPIIAILVKCNHDIKLLLPGVQMSHIIFYITKYIAKLDSRFHNVSSLLAEGLLFHYSGVEVDKMKAMQERQKDLIFRAVNVLNREQELAAPLVVSYLMGWGDVYCSHQYAMIYWCAFTSWIYRSYPNLKSSCGKNQAGGQPTMLEPTSSSIQGGEQEDLGGDRDTDAVQPNTEPDSVVLQFDDTGKLRHRSQLDDYMLRGVEASDYNVLEYFVGTYEQAVLKSSKDAISRDNTQAEEDSVPGSSSARPAVRGRPRHKRIPYLPEHLRYTTHVRVVRPPEHNTLPNIVGPQFPRRSDPTQAELYSASILTLLKPWRSLADLKDTDQSWSSALEGFSAGADQHTLDIMDNIEHYHTCLIAAEEKQQCPDIIDEDNLMDLDEGFLTSEDLDMNSGTRLLNSNEITETMITEAKARMENQRDVVHGMHAVSIGRAKGLFCSGQAPVQSSATHATGTEIQQLKGWLASLKHEVATQNNTNVNAGSNTNKNGDVIALNSSEEDLGASGLGTTPHPIQEQAIEPASPTQLFPEQMRAFSIVQWHLDQTLDPKSQKSTEKIPQMLMLLIGEGGTGKSKVIQTITQEFEKRGVEHMLVKSAYTGIAASLIDGKTTHHIGCIAVGNKSQTVSLETRKRLSTIWKKPRYQIIDECSMISKPFLAQLSRHIQMGRMEHDASTSDAPFGGVNVLLCGDLHQFPPVAVSNGALYHATQSETSPSQIDGATGQLLYEKFETVVTLKKQVQVTDDKWRGFLDALRHGRVKDHHIEMLKTLVLTHPKCPPTNFRSTLWQGCSLVTPRHSVRRQWNEAAVEEHCRQTGHQLLICPAEDTVADRKGRRPPTNAERYVAAGTKSGRKGSKNGGKERGGLSDEVPLAIGIRVMVTLNVETDLDVANGARGTIVGIVLDPLEAPIDKEAAVVKLQRMPSHILIRLDRTRAMQLQGLDKQVLPIVPASKNYRIIMPIRQKDGSVANVQRTIYRRQFPITPAYAFTDYRSQGQTLPAAIIDIATPPTGNGLSLYNLYVALSRCAGRDNVRILRDFDEKIFMKSLDYDLLKEDRRLEKLDQETEEWWNKIDVSLHTEESFV